jgi:carboxylesterase
MIWDYENLLTRRLILWAASSILAGLFLIVFGNPFWQAFGVQAVAWGGIDALIGWFGLRKAKQNVGKPATNQKEEQESKKLRRTLWINSALDVLYIVGGISIVLFLGSRAEFWRGTGWGVILQGTFLYIFDISHAVRIPEPLSLPHIPLFTHPDHQPFLFKAENPAAVLVHGFPGTALEMRHIGKALNAQGCTVSGLRLPGFGPDLINLTEYTSNDWAAYIRKEIQSLRDQGHSPLLLVGYSFGGGLALQVAAEEELDGLALIAPLTWRNSAIMDMVVDYVRALFPTAIYPLRRIPVDSPFMESNFLKVLPEIDPNDPNHVQELKHLQLPMFVIEQIREVGQAGLAAAPRVKIPCLLIQGAQDNVIRPATTKHLQAVLGGDVTYEVVDGSHSMTMPHNPAFEEVLANVTAFGEKIKNKTN